MNSRKTYEQAEMVNPSETAALLGVTPATVRRWAHMGKIPYIHLPSGRMKFRRSDVEKLLSPVASEEGESVDDADASRMSLDVPFPALVGV